MFLFAHLGYTFLAAELLSYMYFWLFLRKKETESSNSWGLNRFAILPLAIGAMGPDIIDKSIFMLTIGYGRYLAHSLLFAILISIVVILLFRKKPQIYYSFILGWIMHLLLDALGGFIPLLFPFVKYTFPAPLELNLSTLAQIMAKPYVYCNEIFGFISIVSLGMLYSRRGFTFKTMLHYNLSLSTDL
ncbi:MAG: metal-dependent hydrolase [Candidatus Heimdallarchaeaceae archaeon]